MIKPCCTNCGAFNPKMTYMGGKPYCPGACVVPRRAKTQADVDALRKTRMEGRKRCQ